MINKKNFVLFSVLILTLFVTTSVQAEKVLFFSPTRVLLNDKDRVETISITNLSKYARSYNISVENLVMTEEGVTAQVEHFDYSAKRMLRFVPRKFDLQPNQRQTVRIMSRIPPDAGDGDYHAHLRFLENISRGAALNEKPQEGNSSMQAYLSYAAAIPVVISHGRVETGVGMKDVRVETGEKRNDITVKMRVTRDGNGQGVAYFDTNYVAPSGTESTATVRRTAYIYRELNERDYSYNFSLPDNIPPKGGSLKISIFDSNKENAEPVDQITVPIPD